MKLFLILLVMVGAATPSESKTVEQLEQEIDFLKMKFENIEAETKRIKDIEAETKKIKDIEADTKKIKADVENIKSTTVTDTTKANMNGKTGNNTEDRLSYLEEMIKLNVIRTCDEMSQFGIRANNFYHIDPDGPLTGADPFRVWCEFNQEGRAITEVLHNSEQSFEVEKCPEPGCYQHHIAYTAPDAQIQALIQLSEACEQTIKYDCLLAPLMDADINFGYWSDKNDEPQVYWDGAHHGQHVCSCFYQPDGCLEHEIKNTTCHCDAQVPEMMADSGTITNKTALPITSLQFGGLVYDIQQASHTLGRLRCWGKAAYEEGTSCVAIKKSGQFHSGFYNVRENEADNTDLVFCNMTKSPGYGENDGGQTFIESSETHFEQVEKDIVEINDDISKINEDISQVEEDLVLVNEDIGNIKHDVPMHSNFCGYRYHWTSSNTAITYQKLLVEDNNIPGATFDASTGRYTAGTAGTYQVDLSIGRMYSSSSYYNYMHIRLNNADIAESQINSRIYTSSSSNEAGGRSMMIKMNQGDTVSVYGHNINDINYITFCVNFINAST